MNTRKTTVQITLPAEPLRSKAEARGLSPEEYLRDLLIADIKVQAKAHGVSPEELLEKKLRREAAKAA